MRHLRLKPTLLILGLLFQLLDHNPLINQAHAESADLLRPTTKETNTPSLVEAAIFFLEQSDNVPVAGDRYVTEVRKAGDQDVSNAVTYWKQVRNCVVRKTTIETNATLAGTYTPGGYLGMGNQSSVTEYDLTKVGTTGIAEAQDGDVYLIFKEKPGFCKNLLPKNYTSPDAEGYRVWGRQYGPGPQQHLNSDSAVFKSLYSDFYTDYFFGDPSLAPGKLWTTSIDEKVHAWLLQHYKQHLMQDVNQIADKVDAAEYIGKACDLHQRRYKLDVSRGIEYAKEQVQRITKAREYLEQSFQCNYDEGPRKPY
jgi:hypothetical protein